MSAVVRPLRERLSSKTLREMARRAHVSAVVRLDHDDLDGFFAGLREVKKLDDDARDAHHFEEECRLTARALVEILEKAGRA